MISHHSRITVYHVRITTQLCPFPGSETRTIVGVFAGKAPAPGRITLKSVMRHNAIRWCCTSHRFEVSFVFVEGTGRSCLRCHKIAKIPSPILLCWKDVTSELAFC